MRFEVVTATRIIFGPDPLAEIRLIAEELGGVP